MNLLIFKWNTDYKRVSFAHSSTSCLLLRILAAVFTTAARPESGAPYPVQQHHRYGPCRMYIEIYTGQFYALQGAASYFETAPFLIWSKAKYLSQAEDLWYITPRQLEIYEDVMQ